MTLLRRRRRTFITVEGVRYETTPLPWWYRLAWELRRFNARAQVVGLWRL